MDIRGRSTPQWTSGAAASYAYSPSGRKEKDYGQTDVADVSSAVSTAWRSGIRQIPPDSDRNRTGCKLFTSPYCRDHRCRETGDLAVDYECDWHGLGDPGRYSERRPSRYRG